MFNHYERILEKLTEYKLYDKLNKNDYNTGDCGYCNKVKTKLSQYNGNYDLCCRFAKNLIKLSTILHERNNSNERCRYFNFWINYSIRKIINTYDKVNIKNKCCNNNVYLVCPYSLNFKEWCKMYKIYTKLSCDETKATDATPQEHGTDRSMEGRHGDGMSHSASSSSREQNNLVTGDMINNNTYYYAKLGVSLSFLGILSTFFYLYKFTTFGN
ncbi:PIR Superfamily Protein [Plasmodium ovale wallikeri]|uniref:PIR Superfamily Protein n=2 Tax=Plasmodium ovale TaxID=36330 RepID=A0A1A8WK55_PLAOA|nr:PIR Superfamily Protein [Plasmodium ovale curtisi]SBS99101.1 PIR Superfamily Protein [Plasmodium ovale curtisi]SBT56221.1 PIR Superfamily Protein [Plasmodium ovale wallikeri]SBT57801.1 PIR Superfamily Protein [Plasmodium ovale wallikeri]